MIFISRLETKSAQLLLCKLWSSLPEERGEDEPLRFKPFIEKQF